MFNNEHHHHRSPFPVIVILLTVALIVFMVFTFTDKKPKKQYKQFENTEIISDENYQKELSVIIKDFLIIQDRVEDDLQKLISAENTLTALLSMKVPPEYKDSHLELALSLNEMQSGLKSENHDGTEGFERFKKTVSRFSWNSL